MGTSSSNRGPQRRSPLLPDWYNPSDMPDLPPPDTDDSNDKTEKDSQSEQSDVAKPVTGNWAAGKGALTRTGNRTAGSGVQKAAKSYVRSLGGSRSATKSAAVGVSAGARFSSFWGGVATNGFEETLRQAGLSDLIGKSSEEVLASVADMIAPPGTTNDEAIAREAIISTLEYLYEKFSEEGRDIVEIQQLDSDTLKEIVIEYASNFVFTKWLHELGIAIEKCNISVRDAVKLEIEIKEYVKEEVRGCYVDKDIRQINLNDENNKSVLTEILLNTYKTLEK